MTGPPSLSTPPKPPGTSLATSAHCSFIADQNTPFGSESRAAAGTLTAGASAGQRLSTLVAGPGPRTQDNQSPVLANQTPYKDAPGIRGTRTLTSQRGGRPERHLGAEARS